MPSITLERTQFFEEILEVLKTEEFHSKKDAISFPKCVKLYLSDNEDILKESIRTRMGFNNYVIQPEGINNVLIANYILKHENEVSFTAIPKTLLINIASISNKLLNTIDMEEDELVENYLSIDLDNLSEAKQELSNIAFASEQLTYQNITPNNDLLHMLGEWQNAVVSLFEIIDLEEDKQLHILISKLISNLEAFASFE